MGTGSECNQVKRNQVGMARMQSFNSKLVPDGGIIDGENRSFSQAVAADAVFHPGFRAPHGASLSKRKWTGFHSRL